MTQQQQPYLEVLTPSRVSKVLVLHANNGESTFVVPAGFTDKQVLEMEAKTLRERAQVLFEEARSHLRRADMAEIAFGLIEA